MWRFLFGLLGKDLNRRCEAVGSVKQLHAQMLASSVWLQKRQNRYSAQYFHYFIAFSNGSVL